jgi:phospholipid transport system substrate-binding protein
LIRFLRNSRRVARTLCLFTAVIAALPAWAAETQTARAFIRETADQVLVILADGSLDSPKKIARIEELAGERFDFPTVTRLALAQNWKKLSDSQKADFTREFKKHLSVTYGKNIDNYADQKVEITADREEPRGDWTVQTEIVGTEPGSEIMVDYRLRKIDGEWKIIDVVVERVSLISNFRSQLRELISAQGVDKTLEVLRQKNAAGESILPEDEQVPRKDR